MAIYVIKNKTRDEYYGGAWSPSKSIVGARLTENHKSAQNMLKWLVRHITKNGTWVTLGNPDDWEIREVEFTIK